MVLLKAIESFVNSMYFPPKIVGHPDNYIVVAI